MKLQPNLLLISLKNPLQVAQHFYLFLLLNQENLKNQASKMSMVILELQATLLKLIANSVKSLNIYLAVLLLLKILIRLFLLPKNLAIDSKLYL